MLARHALRGISVGRSAIAAASARSCATTSLPLAADARVNLIFIDQDGQRHRIQGRSGQTLAQVARDHHLVIQDDCVGSGFTEEVVSENYVADKYGEGVCCGNCRVLISTQHIGDAPPPMEDELRVLADVPEEEQSPNMRLGCRVRVNHDMDGAAVVLSDLPPNEVP